MLLKDIWEVDNIKQVKRQQEDKKQVEKHCREKKEVGRTLHVYCSFKDYIFLIGTSEVLWVQYRAIYSDEQERTKHKNGC